MPTKKTLWTIIIRQIAQSLFDVCRLLKLESSRNEVKAKKAFVQQHTSTTTTRREKGMYKKKQKERERERQREREAFIASKNNFTVLHCRSVTVSVTVTVYSVTEKGMNKERERERGVHRIEEQLYNSALSQCYSVS